MFCGCCCVYPCVVAVVCGPTIRSCKAGRQALHQAPQCCPERSEAIEGAEEVPPQARLCHLHATRRVGLAAPHAEGSARRPGGLEGRPRATAELLSRRRIHGHGRPAPPHTNIVHEHPHAGQLLRWHCAGRFSVTWSDHVVPMRVHVQKKASGAFVFLKCRIACLKPRRRECVRDRQMLLLPLWSLRSACIVCVRV